MLAKDLPAKRATSQLGGLRTSKKVITALKGELLVAIPSHDRVPRKDGKKPRNFRLVRDTTVTLRAEAEEVAPLDREDFLLLEAIKSAHSRFDTYISADKMKWALSLKEGSEVSVVMNHEVPQICSRAVVRWVGELEGKERGTVFGVEIMVL